MWCEHWWARSPISSWSGRDHRSLGRDRTPIAVTSITSEKIDRRSPARSLPPWSPIGQFLTKWPDHGGSVTGDRSPGSDRRDQSRSMATITINRVIKHTPITWSVTKSWKISKWSITHDIFSLYSLSDRSWPRSSFFFLACSDRICNHQSITPQKVIDVIDRDRWPRSQVRSIIWSDYAQHWYHLQCI